MTTKRIFGVSKWTDDALVDIADSLPHGSGINCDWFGVVKRDSIRLTNDYHCMTESRRFYIVNN